MNSGKERLHKIANCSQSLFTVEQERFADIIKINLIGMNKIVHYNLAVCMDL